MFPEYWIDFIQAHALIGVSACLGESDDLSGVGADLQFLTEAQAKEELEECSPGIGVAPDGYVPVAWCSRGSGDYYYINRSDGADGPLYRVHHDSVGPDGYDPKTAVAIVLARTGLVLNFLVR